MAVDILKIVNPIKPSVALNAIKGADGDEMLGIQFGRPHPAGGARPPRIYMSETFFVNAEPTGVIAHVMEAGGIMQAWEIPESRETDIIQRLATKAAECAPEIEDVDNLEDEDPISVFFAGNEDMATKVRDLMDISDSAEVKLNEGEPEYIPEPTS